MKRYHKAPLASICAAAIILFSGCSAHINVTDEKSKPGESSRARATSDEADAHSALSRLGIDPGSLNVYPEVLHDENNAPGFQLDMPQKGDTVAVVKTSLGDFTLRFFPDQAPKAVTNFINLAKNGSYDSTTFFEVINGSHIKAGHCGNDSSLSNGKSSFGGNFEDEFCDSLFNIRGAVSMDNSAQDSNGSRFVINTSKQSDFVGWNALEENWSNMKEQLKSYKDSNLLQAFVDENGGKLLNTEAVPENVRKLYEQNGGNPMRDGAYNAVDRGNTVFAQVIDGFETLDKISAVKTDKQNVPSENVSIKSITIQTY